MVCARLDLNADVGEGSPGETDLLPLVTSVHIACGGHAGDEASMRAALVLARANGVAVGSHPSWIDPEHFGRRELSLPAAEAQALVVGQTRRLQSLADALGYPLRQVKPHGALYNQAARDPALAGAVLAAMEELAPLRLVAPSGSFLFREARRRGLPVAAELFADRRYQPDGTLVPRHVPGSVLSEVSEGVAQVDHWVRTGCLRALDGSALELEGDTLCLHGDGRQAVALARALRQHLTSLGVALEPLRS